MARAFRWSRAIYRLALYMYPTRFRRRFGRDMEDDFARLIAARGRAAAWSRILADLACSVVATHAHSRRTRRHLRAIAYQGEGPMGSLALDFRHAVRTLLKAPAFTSVTVLTLALGIGANSAIFSLVNAVLLRPLGYERPERLMLIYEGIPKAKFPKITVSPPDFVDMTQYQTSFTAIGAYRAQLYELSGAGEPALIQGTRVSATVFPILGVRPALGRTFLESEDQPGHDVVVLSYGVWQRRFAGNPAAIGQQMTLDRRPYTIVGVMPGSFEFPKRGPHFNGEPAAVWTPLALNPFERLQARSMMYNHSVVGRLRDGVSIEQAAADTSTLAPRILKNYPASIQSSIDLTVTAVPLVDEIAGQVQRPLLILLGAVGLVLLVACANVANLVLTRAVTRQREIGVRAALGAGRHRLLQMLLIESVMLALAGGALGLLVGYWTVRAMPSVIATSLPGVHDVMLDARVVVFTLSLSALTAIVFGIVPLLAGQRRDLNDLLRDGAARTTAGLGQHRLQAGLVVSSVALAFVLLVSAGLLMRSFSNLMAVDPGFRPANVLSMQVTLPHAGYNSAAPVRAFYRGLYERIRAIPGVRTASIATDLPLKADGERRAFTPERRDDTGGLPPSAAVTWVHGDFFGTYGIPIVKGRTFLPEEEVENRQVAIVSRAIAERFWPGEDPIGKRIKWGLAVSTAPWNTVVGVAGDVVDGKLGEEPIIHIYVPYAEAPDQLLATPIVGLLRRMTIAAVGPGDATTLIAPVRGAIAALDAALAVSDVTTMAQVVADASAPQRFSTLVLAAFAGGALLLAAIGLYGVLAFGVAQRTREIGVRLALGASRGEVLGLVVRQGMTLTAIGLAIGIAGALAATRLMTALLYQTQPFDPMTFALVPVLLTAVALLACYLPARRAARVEPVVALRAE
jgi:putative ABC transport system permease protein